MEERRKKRERERERERENAKMSVKNGSNLVIRG